MAGTASPGPSGLAASTRGKVFDQDHRPRSKDVAGRLLGAVLDRHKLALPASAILLATFATASHLAEPNPEILTAAVALIAAVILALSWVAQETRDEAPKATSDAHPYSPKGRESKIATQAGLSAPPSGSQAISDLAHAPVLAQLTARISHELRTPLNALIGFSELMSTETFGPLGSSRYQDYAHHIRECGHTLLKSTEDTLAITSALAQTERDASTVLRAVSLTAILDEACACLAMQLGLQKLHLARRAPEMELFGDHRVLRQIFVNLLQEAITRADEQSANVTISADLSGTRAFIHFSAIGHREMEHEDSLAVCVARTLLELNGQSLHSRVVEDNKWIASITLERVLQPDFFPDANSTMSGRKAANLEG
jgi:signal transduction histidine kinase